ncbi:MAG: hypothetical protein JNJ57_05570 [Saprospiraceae bacterium]|nr:hypothetical protein [Saprospiraceae bacterium]
MKNTFFLLLICLTCLSCRKDKLESGRTIETYASRLADPAQAELFKLRACFTKAVAKAFANREFAAYFKKNFCVAQDNHFKELVFSRHLNDPILSNGTTLRELIEACVDAEIEDIFGKRFIETLLDKDPCVVIKLPDLLRTVDWDTECLIPMAIAVGPSPHVVFPEKLSYLAYFHTGNHDEVHDPMAYFHCTIKRSEDYLLLDSVYLYNDQAISFYEFLPQAEKAPDGMRSELLSISEPMDVYAGKVLINKLDAFRLWKDKYGYTGPFYFENTTCINPECLRECLEPEESILVLDSMSVYLPMSFEFHGNVFLDETYTYSFTFWSNTNHDLLGRIAVPGVPHEYFETRIPSVKIKSNNKFQAPRIDFNWKDSGFTKSFPVQSLVSDAILPGDEVYFSIDFLGYTDEIGYHRLLLNPNPSVPEVHSQYLFDVLGNSFNACMPPGNISSGLAGRVHLRY